MKRKESHRQVRGLSFPSGTSSCGFLELKLQAVQERVMIDRGFVNCPSSRHSSTLALLYSQQLTNGSVIALHRTRGLNQRPHVKNPERSEWRSCS